MPQRAVRLLISFAVVIHLLAITLALLAHRGASYLNDDILSAIAPYTAFGNWKADTNRLPIASTSQLGEIVRIEWHQRGAPADDWRPGPETEMPNGGRSSSRLTRRQRFEQHWLHQLSGLLLFDNDDGVGQMLMAALPKVSTHNATEFDRVRVTVAPRLSLEQYAELGESADPRNLPETSRPQVAFVASIIDLGNGQYSLLRQMEEHRASKSILPSNHPTEDGVKRP